jgi:hypothetical protein
LEKIVLRSFLFTTVLLSLSGNSHAESYDEKFQRLSDEHHQMIKNEPGKSYEVELINSHNEFWRFVYQKCNPSAQKANIESFSAIAVVDSDGFVKDFLTMPKSRHLSCYKRVMKGKQYPKPPVAPFYELYKIGISSK